MYPGPLPPSAPWSASESLWGVRSGPGWGQGEGGGRLSLMALDAIWLWGSARVVSLSYMEMPRSDWKHCHALVQVATCIVSPQHSSRAGSSRRHSLRLQTALRKGSLHCGPWAPRRFPLWFPRRELCSREQRAHSRCSN